MEESEQERVSQLLSLEHLQKILGSGKEKMVCSYRRKVEGVMQPVSAEIFPRRFGKRGELEEFMVYVYQRNDRRVVIVHSFGGIVCCEFLLL